MHTAVVQRGIVVDVQFVCRSALIFNFNKHGAARRIDRVGFRDGVVTTLSRVDLTKRKRAGIEQFQTMVSVVAFSFDLAANDDELQRLNIRHIERGIVNLGHHAVVQRKPHFRCKRICSSESVLRGAGPVRVEARRAWSNSVSCLCKQSEQVNKKTVEMTIERNMMALSGTQEGKKTYSAPRTARTSC